MRARGDGTWTFTVVVDRECRQGLDELKALLSHVDPAMSYGLLVNRLVHEELRRRDPRKPGSNRDDGRPPTADGARAKRTVPAKSAGPPGAEGAAIEGWPRYGCAARWRCRSCWRWRGRIEAGQREHLRSLTKSACGRGPHSTRTGTPLAVVRPAPLRPPPDRRVFHDHTEPDRAPTADAPSRRAVSHRDQWAPPMPSGRPSGPGGLPESPYNTIPPSPAILGE